MALFTKTDLRGVSKFQGSVIKSKELLETASRDFSEDKTYDIFISHRFLDADEVYNLKSAIEAMGFTTYVDWVEDKQLDRTKVNKETARLLRLRMSRCKSLFFVTSTNSSDSKWMPWELGYFDGFKQKVAILPILPTENNTNSYEGQEYLGLYPYVTKDKSEQTQKTTLWIREAINKYVHFKSWLEGNLPAVH